METILKETLADFLKIDAAFISPETVIDRSAVGNSILLHRMYARFSQQGIDVPNYNSIRTFGDLVSRVNGDNKVLDSTTMNAFADVQQVGQAYSSAGLSLGIDIESINNFEAVDDYREAAFYKTNFSAEEISYCLLQPNTLLSFAGLFAAKEAIVKADNSYQGINFNTIEIKHNNEGKPFYKNFSISISHTADVAVAVAFLPPQFNLPKFADKITNPQLLPKLKSSTGKNYQMISIVLSLISLILSIYAIVKLSG